MAFCAKCGVPLGENTTFCASCSPPQAVVPPPGLPSVALSSNLAGALTYLLGFITGIIFLAKEPYNKDPFVRFHIFQSIFLSAFFFVLVIASRMMSEMGGGFLWSLIALLMFLVRVAFFLLSLFLMYKAFKKQRFSLPFIGPLAARLA